MDLEQTICFCMNVTARMIKDAVDSGAHTLEEVQEITGAGTVCGSCIDEMEQLIKELVS